MSVRNCWRAVVSVHEHHLQLAWPSAVSGAYVPPTTQLRITLPTQVLLKVFAPVLDWMALRYTATVGKELTKYGLRYEDLYDPLMDLDVKEALDRLPQSEVDARNQRLRRAHDLSLKHEELPKQLQQVQTPFGFYLNETLERVKLENDEKASLGTGRRYDRAIP